MLERVNHPRMIKIDFRYPELGSDIQRVKGMGVDHIIFGYSFLPIGRDVDKMIDISKQLSKFAR